MKLKNLLVDSSKFHKEMSQSQYAKVAQDGEGIAYLRVFNDENHIYGHGILLKRTDSKHIWNFLEDKWFKSSNTWAWNEGVKNPYVSIPGTILELGRSMVEKCATVAKLDLPIPIQEKEEKEEEQKVE